MAMKSARPALRIFDNRLARSFCLDWLAFPLVWEHRTEDGSPCIIEVSRDEATLLLSEHYGYGSPAAKVLIGIDDEMHFIENSQTEGTLTCGLA
jgi:hypothetical protein